jgi:GNAT superfamily N-acetyltransferase
MAKAIFEGKSRGGFPEGKDLGNGRRIVEGPMPEETQWKHTLSSYGEPRRISVYDDNAPESFSGPYLREDKSGEKGLIAYADVYRQPEAYDRASYSVREESGRRRLYFGGGTTNVGYMTAAGKYQGGGVGRQLFDYVINTTPSHVDLGTIAHDSMRHMYKKHRDSGASPSISGKTFLS